MRRGFKASGTSRLSDTTSFPGRTRWWRKKLFQEARERKIFEQSGRNFGASHAFYALKSFIFRGDNHG
jgi:hypothetical protein